MARSRNIKPGFFANEELADLPFEARLLFIGLWTLADREGRLEDRPKRIRAQVFPYDSIDAEPLMKQLASSGFIVRYEVSGERYAQIVNFGKHQMPHHKEVPSEIPAPDGYQQVTRHAYDVPSKVRDSVFARDGGKCLKCGATEALSLDHIKPLGSGGDNSMENLQTLCTPCNSAKGNTTKDYRRVNVGSTSSHGQSKQGASCPSDSGFLIPDSSPLIPDCSTDVESAGKPRKPAKPSIAKPDDVDEQTWADWLTLRKAKKAPVTETVVNGARAESVKAGIGLDGFLKVWCRRGSQGLEASWLNADERSAGRTSETPYQRSMRERMQEAAPEFARKDPSKTAENVVDFFAIEVPAKRLEIGNEPSAALG